jgi:phospholipid N-methyltransferase
MGRLSEWTVFLSEYRRNFHSTGAILPSSRFLARAITRFCFREPHATRVLEAGPGTGAFTDRLIRQLRPGDSLVLVELNERFVHVLRRRLEVDRQWAARRQQIEIHHAPVEELADGRRFDAIVCGLPFNNFEPELVERLFLRLLSLLAGRGMFSFFEYLWIRRLKAVFVGSEERRRLAQVGQIIERLIRRHEAAADRVLLNVPPALVHHLRSGS